MNLSRIGYTLFLHGKGWVTAFQHCHHLARIIDGMDGRVWIGGIVTRGAGFPFGLKNVGRVSVFFFSVSLSFPRSRDPIHCHLQQLGHASDSFLNQFLLLHNSRVLISVAAFILLFTSYYETLPGAITSRTHARPHPKTTSTHTTTSLPPPHKTSNPQMSNSNIPNSLIVLFAILGAGAFVVVCAAASRVYLGAADFEADDGFPQMQDEQMAHMRQVRMRNVLCAESEARRG